MAHDDLDTWRGKPVASLSREELIEAVKALSNALKLSHETNMSLYNLRKSG